MTIGRKIVAGYVLILTLLVIVVIVGSYAVVVLSAGYQELIDVTRMLARSSIELTANVNNQVASSRGFVIFAEEQAAFAEALRRDQQDFEELLATMRTLAPTTEGRAELDAIADSQARQRKVRGRILELAAAGRAAEAAELGAREAMPLETELHNLVDRFRARQVEREAVARTELETTVARLTVLRLTVFALALIGGAVLAVTLSRSTTRQLRDAATSLGTATSEILAMTTEVATTSAETAAAVSQTTTTVGQIKQTAQLSMSKARSVSDASQHTAETGRAGARAVDEAIAGMGRVREQMESVAETVVRLAEQTQAIGEIIATVNDIADQTNLLAVNASIEAARAGEHGRGFTVVAEEVRRLADQSKRATSSIHEILGSISKTVGSAVMVTEQASKAVQAGSRQATEAGEAIRGLAESIGDAAEAALQITASSQQQLAGMDQVATAMASIQQATQQNVAGTRQAEQAAQNLGQLGARLREMVGGTTR